MRDFRAESIFLSIVIPAFNEEKRLLRALVPTVDFLKRQNYSSEIIVVSDGSMDKTREVAESFLNDFPMLRIIEYYPNRGKGFAVKTGMLEAKGKYRIFMDADYAVPIEHLPDFLSLINDGFDIVIASRELSQSRVESHQHFLRELAAKIFGRIQELFLQMPFKDTQCGFKLFNKEAVEVLFPKLLFNCAYFDAELLFMAYYSKMKIGEVGVRWRHDNETRLPIGLRRALEIIKKLFMIRYLHGNRKAL